MPSLRFNKIHCNNYTQELEITIEILSGKWIALLLVHLGENDVVRFNEFRKHIPKITQKMLSQQLKKLESQNIISKEVFNEIPLKVEYSLTQKGKNLLPILNTMQEWGKNYIHD